jgi:muramoyltetrapeptide carboxypeptidase
LLLERLGTLGVPILGELGFGHVPSAPTVPLGIDAELDTEVGTLTLLEPALR